MKLFLLFTVLAVTHLAAGPILLPSTQWGTGVNETSLNIAYNSLSSLTGTEICQLFYGQGTAAPGGGCNNSTASDSAGASASTYAYADATGLHAYAGITSSGGNDSAAQAYADFTDTITNNTGVTADVTIGYTFDGSLTAGPEAGAYVSPYFTGGSKYTDVGLLPGYISDVDNGTETFDQTKYSPVITLAPGQSYSFVISLYTEIVTGQRTGSALGIANFSDTLSLTSFTATDQSGNALNPSLFGSGNGFSYVNSSDSTGAPEPGTLGLFLVSGASLLAAARKRANRPAACRECPAKRPEELAIPDSAAIYLSRSRAAIPPALPAIHAPTIALAGM